MITRVLLSAGIWNAALLSRPAHVKKTTRSTRWTTAPTNELRPTPVTAYAGSTPPFCMNRTFSAIPPTLAGVIRLTNDDAICAPTVGSERQRFRHASHRARRRRQSTSPPDRTMATSEPSPVRRPERDEAVADVGELREKDVERADQSGDRQEGSGADPHQPLEWHRRLPVIASTLERSSFSSDLGRGPRVSRPTAPAAGGTAAQWRRRPARARAPRQATAGSGPDDARERRQQLGPVDRPASGALPSPGRIRSPPAPACRRRPARWRPVAHGAPDAVRAGSAPRPQTASSMLGVDGLGIELVEPPPVDVLEREGHRAVGQPRDDLDVRARHAALPGPQQEKGLMLDVLLQRDRWPRLARAAQEQPPVPAVQDVGVAAVARVHLGEDACPPRRWRPCRAAIARLRPARGSGRRRRVRPPAGRRRPSPGTAGGSARRSTVKTAAPTAEPRARRQQQLGARRVCRRRPRRRPARSPRGRWLAARVATSRAYRPWRRRTDRRCRAATGSRATPAMCRSSTASGMPPASSSRVSASTNTAAPASAGADHQGQPAPPLLQPPGRRTTHGGHGHGPHLRHRQQQLAHCVGEALR